MARSQWSGSRSKRSTNFAKSSITLSRVSGWRGYHQSLAQRWLCGFSISSLFCQAEKIRRRGSRTTAKMNQPSPDWIAARSSAGSLSNFGEAFHRLRLWTASESAMNGCHPATNVLRSSPASSAIIHLRLVHAFLLSDMNMTCGSGAR